MALRLPPSARGPITVGALGTHFFPAGTYLYVGSAWGPGGLQARISRHLRGSLNAHWHVDYLRKHAQPIAVFLAPGTRLECAWARYLTQHRGTQIVVPRFGASDCRCETHLFFLHKISLDVLELPGGPERQLIEA
ncbi:MAG: GIY-YIG nuclease family protein [Anaerolineae bacterium]